MNPWEATQTNPVLQNVHQEERERERERVTGKWKGRRKVKLGLASLLLKESIMGGSLF
jgi:hypothetical protein